VRPHSDLVPFFENQRLARVFGRAPDPLEVEKTGDVMSKNTGIGRGIVPMMSGGAAHATAAESPRWQATAEWHQLLRKPVRGTCFFEDYGVECRSAKVHERWGYVDIRSFVMSIKEHRLELKELRPELWSAEIRIKRVRHL
jgi:hypothetical protein